MPPAKENHSKQSIDGRKVIGVHNKDIKGIKPNECKRMAEHASEDGPHRKRYVLGDLTNNTDKLQKQTKPDSIADKDSSKNESVIKSHILPPPKETRKSKRLSDKQFKLSGETFDASFASAKDCFSSPNQTADKTEYVTPSPDRSPVQIHLPESQDKIPEGVQDFDKEMENDPFSAPIYAQDIFRHFREREVQFRLVKYLDCHREISKHMRAVLVDWMAEVQESFELNHETLYLAVKLVDLYLSRVKSIAKANLQLLACTALLVAAKFDERCPPAIEDFVYICDEAYSANQLIRNEINLLKCIDFDLGIPISYTFLRRYARCSKQTMEILTLARYILELSLMEYNLVDELDSRMAAAALSLALQMCHMEPWNKTLEYYSGYGLSEFSDLVPRLNGLLKKAGKDGLRTIFTKYSHKVFYEVAKKPALEDPMY